MLTLGGLVACEGGADFHGELLSSKTVQGPAAAPDAGSTVTVKVRMFNDSDDDARVSCTVVAHTEESSADAGTTEVTSYPIPPGESADQTGTIELDAHVTGSDVGEVTLEGCSGPG